MKVAARFSGPGLAYEGLAFMHPKAGGQWTGKVRLVEEQLDAPLRWSKPRRIFVNSMSDLFHEELSLEQIAQVFAVMYLAPRHTFQVLTKRAARMREVLNNPRFYRLVLAAAEPLRAHRANLTAIGISDPTKFPAPWVQLGVSVESPEYLSRAEDLLNTPAGIRFISAEPLLAGLDLSEVLEERGVETGGPQGFVADPNRIDWVIVGGESGRGARPFNVEWARTIVRQCKRAGVSCFVKQMGSHVIDRNDAGFNGDEDEPGGWCSAEEYGGQIRVEHDLAGHRDDYQGAPVRVRLANKKGGDPSEWPVDLRVREFPR